MTLHELIKQARDIECRFTATNGIPVIYQGVNDQLTKLELCQDSEGNYFVKIY